MSDTHDTSPHDSDLHLIRLAGDGYECGPTHLALLRGHGDLPALAREFAVTYGFGLPEETTRRLSEHELILREKNTEKARDQLRAEGILDGAEADRTPISHGLVHWLIRVHGWERVHPQRWLLPDEPQEHVLPVQAEQPVGEA